MKKKINREEFRKYCENRVNSLSDEQIEELFNGSFIFESIIFPLLINNCILSKNVTTFIDTYHELSYAITDAMIKVNGRKLRESKYGNEECL